MNIFGRETLRDRLASSKEKRDRADKAYEDAIKIPEIAKLRKDYEDASMAYYQIEGEERLARLMELVLGQRITAIYGWDHTFKGRKDAPLQVTEYNGLMNMFNVTIELEDGSTFMLGNQHSLDYKAAK